MQSDPARHRVAAPRQLRLLLVLFVVSGAAALVYQVLWVRALGLLLGSTAQAAALTIAVFFTGLALGGAVWGRRSARRPDSLRTFGWLEIGVAISALGHLVLLDVYHAVVPALIGPVGGSPGAELAVKVLVASVVLLPPSVLMGGTLPTITAHLVVHREQLGRTGSLLYALNTFGAATGALAAGFVLPIVLGVRGAYLLAVGADLIVGVAALAIARRQEVAERPGPAQEATSTTSQTTAPVPAALPGTVVLVVAAGSGVLSLGAEVLWTRLFAQVLQNSAQTYALVLSVFLLALAIGAALASLLARTPRMAPEPVLAVLLAAAAVALATSPWLFHATTDGLRILGGELGWRPYLLAVAGTAGVVVGLPGIALGAVLPYLLRLLEAGRRAPGHEVGRLVAVNTTGGIVGSLAAGFILLPMLGAVRSLLVLAAGYGVLLAVVVAARRSVPGLALAGAAVAASLALLTLDTSTLPAIRLAEHRGEELVALREGSQATVAVVARGADRLIRVNNTYTLGGTSALDAERNQAIVPLLLHPDPRSVFHLGLGTGITAGASLAFPVERVVVCELLRDVVTASEAHFTPWIGGLFDDPRAVVHAEDGRACLRRSDERFDLINADLFTPWEAGTGNLYTLEHYTAARERLNPGGVYVQWMPLYQVSMQELGIVARTMDEVFDQVLMLRGDLYPERSIVALVGQLDPTPLDAEVARSQARLVDTAGRSDAFYEALALRMYLGNVTASGIAAGFPLNTDAHPRIEFLAPRTQREARAGTQRLLVGAEREALYASLRTLPLADDPALARLDDTQRGYITAGALRSQAAWLESSGEAAQARELLVEARGLEPPDRIEVVSPARVLLPRITGQLLSIAE